MTYQVDRFYAAVTVLAGAGNVKQRLIKAYQDNLDDINEDDLPGPLQRPFADVRRRMYSVAPLNGEGSILASVRKMSVDDASACAVSLVSLYRDLARRSDAAQQPLPVVDESEPVPPFLVKSAS